MRLVRAVLSVIAIAWATVSGTLAEDYPNRPIRLLVPYAAGGPSDAASRLVVQEFGQHLGGTVFIENRGGAGGLTGTEQVIQGEHNGYTVLLGALATMALIPAGKQVQYDVKKELIPLGLIWQSPLVLVVNPKRGLKTLAEFIAFAKANPGKLSISSAGLGTNTHFAGEMFKRAAGIDLLHVPYRSTGAALPDLIAGQVDATISDVALMTPHIREGKFYALAVTAPERSSLLPEVPTMAEAGLPQVRSENWYGLLAPARTPPDAVTKLKTALDAAVKSPTFREALAKQGATIRDTGANGFAKLIDSEIERWTPIVRASGVQF